MMNLKDMRIGKRLALGFGIAIVLAIAIAATGWWANESVSTAADKASAQGGRNLLRSKAMQDNSFTNYIVLKIVTAPDKEHENAYKAQLAEMRQTLKAELAEIESGAVSAEAKQLAANMVAATAAQRETNNHAMDLAANGKRDQAMQLMHGEAGERMAATLSVEEQLLNLSSRQREELIAEKAAITSKARWILGILSFLAVGISVAFALFITRSISAPLGQAVYLLNQVSKGDISHDIHKENADRKDEVGDLARALHTTIESLRKLVSDLSQGIQTVASSATELSAASAQAATSAKSMSEKSATVAAAAEESCATSSSVSASMERASANLTSVAGATEQMSSTVAEIASNSEKARAISEKAMAQAQTISTIMSELGRAAQEIGKVTETITDISAQTNLLALNATIEAARAGSAGKGFAVVANEIKELAKQTSEATEDIKAKIAGVQNSTTGAVQTIETITGVIKEIGNTVASTAAAIEEQATVTKNVAGEIAQATTVVREVNEQVAQTASVSRSIASDIATVNSATADIRGGGEQVQSSATELSRLSEHLKVLVAQFSV